LVPKKVFAEKGSFVYKVRIKMTLK